MRRRWGGGRPSTRRKYTAARRRWIPPNLPIPVFIPSIAFYVEVDVARSRRLSAPSGHGVSTEGHPPPSRCDPY
jgi:hypothetical protein